MVAATTMQRQVGSGGQPQTHGAARVGCVHSVHSVRSTHTTHVWLQRGMWWQAAGHSGGQAVRTSRSRCPGALRWCHHHLWCCPCRHLRQRDRQQVPCCWHGNRHAHRHPGQGRGAHPPTHLYLQHVQRL